MARVVGVVALEFAVCPQSFEVSRSAIKQNLLGTLRQLHSPLETTGESGPRQVGAANVGRPEPTVTMKQPGLGMQPRAAAVERHAYFASGQPRQFVQGTRLRGAGVSRGENAKPGCHVATATTCRDLLQYVLQSANPRHRNEADQDVHLIGRSQLLADLLQQRWRSLAGGKKPGHRQTKFRRLRELPVAPDGPQDLRRRCDQVDSVRGSRLKSLQSLAQQAEQGVDDLDLTHCRGGVFAVSTLEHA